MVEERTRVYDVASNAVREVPTADLPPGLVQAEVAGVAGAVWVDPAQLARSQAAHPLCPAPPSPMKRVLVVDDNSDAADTLVVLLKLLGCEPRACYGGQTAVEAARTFQPDLVLLDL